MLLYRDLDKFCAALGEGNKTYRDCKHSLDMKNIFTVATFPRKYQELLLRPYITHLHGFPHFQIPTYVSSELGQSALTSIKHLAWSHPDNVIQCFTQKHALAVAQFLANDYTTSPQNLPVRHRATFLPEAERGLEHNNHCWRR
ncbi:uncharacterized protein BDZ99DRAFT_525467 [Mytilinidion resinicola]|uniref:Uncharacterized protein n=1 Tax=Mytilinidion resinicola TaxID=574789 RepID=A0A6A6Y9H3_9PEZI|nr:uncharacterized protein BDZ99DRAFT_525467 [Mytilinidion resinicola]KAF2804634.1 hypothetical protein BDZ99DRAFT_525467 [Mytilinidion resinicola]